MVMLIPQSFPFSPPNGPKYEAGVRMKKATLQEDTDPALDIHHTPLPARFSSPHFLPPMFHLGRAVGEDEDELLELVKNKITKRNFRFPELVLYSYILNEE
ncbi:hypothetical protein PTI98_009538 [Pleurotus ostreatus]|nr:hypothetical protein PTI98_009538 [Pleurotus ostreatus]